jgi:vancomycin resistance protein YoaR
VRILVATAAALFVLVLGVGFAFAGSPDRLPDGVTIAGVDVGGMTPRAATALLARRSDAAAEQPVTFVAGAHSWQITPKELGVEEDWSRAVAEAMDRGEGWGFVRGLRRVGLRVFPVEVEPAVSAYNSAVEYKVSLLAEDLDRPHRDARLVRRGLSFQLYGGETGRVLDRAAAAELVVAALANSPGEPVQLPVAVDPPTVTLAQLRRVRAKATRVVSAPVTLRIGIANFVVEPRRLARMLELPSGGTAKLSFGGPAADAYFKELDDQVSAAPKNAEFVVGSGGAISITPARTGTALDIARTEALLLAAAQRAERRVAPIVVETAKPERTTAAAHAMGISGLVGSYETIYGGIPNRIHNVQLVARLIDGTLIAPGSTFSFNETTGERSAEKGFLEAPVIINGELQTGLGGGVCQVSTTVFNAAYEAGLPITSRTNHALYISHYPLGRDATVDYPGIDLKFRNDTGKWLLLRTFVGSSSLVVNLYGTPQDRRVETVSAPLRTVGPAPIEKRIDESVAPGTRVVESSGVPAQATSVTRRVYAAGGKLLSESTWYSSYRAEPRVVLIGPPKKPKPPKKKPAAEEATPVTPTGPAPPQ